MKIQNSTVERITHFGIGIALGLMTLTACSPTTDTQEVAINECIVSVTAAYLGNEGDVTQDVFEAIQDKCKAEVRGGEWS